MEAFDCNALLERLFASRRRLRPARKARKPVVGSGEVTRMVEMVIVEGVDLPVRSDETAKTSLYVEVSFQGQKFQTDVKPGPNPIWNQRASLNLSSTDWSQQALLNTAVDCFT